MRILFLSDDFPPTSFGGAGISTYELALGMKKAGHEVFVITTCRKASDAGVFEYNGIKIHRIANDYHPRWRAYVSIYNMPVLRQVKQLLKDINPDVAHINNVHFYLSYYCLVLAKRYAKAVVFTARDVMAFNFGKLVTPQYLEKFDYHVSWRDRLRQSKKRWNPLLFFFVKRYLKYADAIFAISKALKEALVKNGIAPVDVIYNGIDVGDWNVSQDTISTFKSRFNLENKQVLLFSGRLNESKGGSKVITALQRIKKEVPNTVLLVAGSIDVYANRMRQEAKNLGIEESIIFTGWIEREDIRTVYAVSDVVLMPSVCFDAFGRVNIEAMASKKPVVGTCFGGTPEVVLDGVTGYIVNPLHPEEIAEKTIDLLQNPEKAKQFGETGYARAQQKFNLEDKVKEYILVYELLYTRNKNIL